MSKLNSALAPYMVLLIRDEIYSCVCQDYRMILEQRSEHNTVYSTILLWQKWYFSKVFFLSLNLIEHYSQWCIRQKVERFKLCQIWPYTGSHIFIAIYKYKRDSHVIVIYLIPFKSSSIQFYYYCDKLHSGWRFKIHVGFSISGLPHPSACHTRRSLGNFTHCALPLW